MEDLLKKIFEKVEKIDDSISEINVTTAKQQLSLDEHIRRTELAEESIDRLHERTANLEKERSYLYGIVAGVIFIGSVLFGLIQLGIIKI